MIDYDDDYIVFALKFGTQSDVIDKVNVEYYKFCRKTFEVTSNNI